MINYKKIQIPITSKGRHIYTPYRVKHCSVLTRNNKKFIEKQRQFFEKSTSLLYVLLPYDSGKVVLSFSLSLLFVLYLIKSNNIKLSCCKKKKEELRLIISCISVKVASGETLIVTPSRHFIINPYLPYTCLWRYRQIENAYEWSGRAPWPRQSKYSRVKNLLVY